MSDQLIVNTDADLRALAAIESWQAEQRYRLHRRRAVRSEGFVPLAGARPRALPSGLPQNWTGLALALLLLILTSLATGIALIIWGVYVVIRPLVGK